MATKTRPLRMPIGSRRGINQPCRPPRGSGHTDKLLVVDPDVLNCSRPARCARPSQPQKPDGCFAGRSSATLQRIPVGLTWLKSRLASCAVKARQAHPHPGVTRIRDRGMGATAKRIWRPHQMDVHHRESAHENGPRLSANRRYRNASQTVIITVQRY